MLLSQTHALAKYKALPSQTRPAVSVLTPKPEGLQEEPKPPGQHAAVPQPCLPHPEPSSQERNPCAVRPVSARCRSQHERLRRRSCHLLDTHPARLAPPGSVPVGAELSSERRTSQRRRFPRRFRRRFSPAAPPRAPRPGRAPLSPPPPGRLPRKPRTRSSAPCPSVGWGRAGERPQRPRPRPAMPQP